MIDNSKCWLQDNCNKIDCDKFCMRLFKLDSLYENALITLTQRKHITFRLDSNQLDRDAFIKLRSLEDNILNFVKEGKNLYLHSMIAGNGKTSWSLRLIEDYFNKIWSKSSLECKALFINVPKFLLALKDNLSDKSEYIQHIKDNVLNCDIVIWDDIGTKVITNFESENLLSMIDSRISNGKSNIYTSNLTPQEMHECLGDRLFSRICNMSIDIELRGYDKRNLTI